MPPPIEQSLRLETVVPLPPIGVWHAFTVPEHISYWLGDPVEVDLRVGGAYVVRCGPGFRLDATIEKLAEGRRLVLRPTRRADDTRIELDIVKLAGAESRVTITDGDSVNDGAWRDALENLQSVWGKGVDLRESRRPIMGIGPREISAEERPLRGVPEGTGVRLGALLPGGPAERAGLKSGDIVITFDGVPMRSAGQLVERIRAGRSGEVVSIEAVRDGRPVSAAVTLGHRPGRGEPPPDPQALIRTLRQTIEESDAKLERTARGLSDRDVYRPEGANRWSVAQVLAHLSITERMLQCWLDEAARGSRPAADDASCVSASRIAAVLERRPSVRALLDRICQDERETLAFLGHIAPSLAPFKPRWARVALTALDFHCHSRDHLGQLARIRKAIGA